MPANPTIQKSIKLSIAEAKRILGVGPGIGLRQLRGAYLKAAKRLHPDIAQSKTNAHEQFIRLNQAYELLKSARLLGKCDSLPADFVPNSASNYCGKISWMSDDGYEFIYFDAQGKQVKVKIACNHERKVQEQPIKKHNPKSRNSQLNSSDFGIIMSITNSIKKWFRGTS